MSKGQRKRQEGSVHRYIDELVSQSAKAYADALDRALGDQSQGPVVMLVLDPSLARRVRAERPDLIEGVDWEESKPVPVLSPGPIAWPKP